MMVGRMDRRMYTAFIFDLDGTIIDSEMIGLTALQATLKDKELIRI